MTYGLECIHLVYFAQDTSDTTAGKISLIHPQPSNYHIVYWACQPCHHWGLSQPNLHVQFLSSTPLHQLIKQLWLWKHLLGNQMRDVAIQANWQSFGKMMICAFIHEGRHMDLMKISDDSDCLAVVNSRPAMLFTRSDGVEVVELPR